jgi:hypothetical protein
MSCFVVKWIRIIYFSTLTYIYMQITIISYKLWTPCNFFSSLVRNIIHVYMFIIIHLALLWFLLLNLQLSHLCLQSCHNNHSIFQVNLWPNCLNNYLLHIEYQHLVLVKKHIHKCLHRFGIYGHQINIKINLFVFNILDSIVVNRK